MTHEELLAEIDNRRDYAVERFGSDDGFNALRAVVEYTQITQNTDDSFSLGWDAAMAAIEFIIKKELA